MKFFFCSPSASEVGNEPSEQPKEDPRLESLDWLPRVMRGACRILLHSTSPPYNMRER
jgi:hypothetical protein